jgi:hypothetical protein
MTIRTHATPNYEFNRREEIFGAEGIRRYAYADTQGIPTIGYGLNLRTHGWLVLDAWASTCAKPSLRVPRSQQKRAISAD